MQQSHSGSTKNEGDPQGDTGKEKQEIKKENSEEEEEEEELQRKQDINGEKGIDEKTGRAQPVAPTESNASIQSGDVQEITSTGEEGTAVPTQNNGSTTNAEEGTGVSNGSQPIPDVIKKEDSEEEPQRKQDISGEKGTDVTTGRAQPVAPTESNAPIQSGDVQETTSTGEEGTAVPTQNTTSAEEEQPSSLTDSEGGQEEEKEEKQVAEDKPELDVIKKEDSEEELQRKQDISGEKGTDVTTGRAQPVAPTESNAPIQSGDVQETTSTGEEGTAVPTQNTTSAGQGTAEHPTSAEPDVPTQNSVSSVGGSSTSNTAQTEEQPSSFFGSLFSILMKPFSLIGSFFGGFFSWLFGSNTDESTSQTDAGCEGESSSCDYDVTKDE